MLLFHELGSDAETASRRALKLAEKIHTALATPMVLGGEADAVTITASLGITLCPQGPEDEPAEALRRVMRVVYAADQADQLNGQGGNETLVFVETNIDLSSTTLVSVETVLGTDGNDVVTVNTGDVTRRAALGAVVDGKLEKLDDGASGANVIELTTSAPASAWA